MSKYTTRQDFGYLFNEHRRTRLGVEVGVQNGYNSKQITAHWDGILICVDLWLDLSVYETAKETLKECHAILLRGDSLTIAAQFADESLDFVYIDAGHSYQEVKADYEAWYPKVRNGGVISGHDYAPESNKNDCDGVRQFIEQLGIPFYLTTDDFWEGMEYQSWWFIKGEDKNLSDVI